MSINTTRHEVPEICNAVLDRNCYNRRRPLFTFRLTDLTKHNLDICTVPNITVRILVIHYILHPNLEGKKSIQHFIFFSLSRSLFFFLSQSLSLIKIKFHIFPSEILHAFFLLFYLHLCVYSNLFISLEASCLLLVCSAFCYTFTDVCIFVLLVHERLFTRNVTDGQSCPEISIVSCPNYVCASLLMRGCP